MRTAGFFAKLRRMGLTADLTMDRLCCGALCGAHARGFERNAFRQCDTPAPFAGIDLHHDHRLRRRVVDLLPQDDEIRP